MSGSPRSEGIHDLAIKYATVRVVENSEDPAAKAARIREFAEEAKSLASDDGVMVSTIRIAIENSIDWRSLTDGERRMASELIKIVAMELEHRLGSGVLDGESLLTVQDVLELVISGTYLVE